MRRSSTHESATHARPHDILCLSVSLSLCLSVLALVATPVLASVFSDQVQSQHIREADGTSAQDTNVGSGVKTGHIQNFAVTSSKIADGAVGSVALAPSSVTSDKIADGQVGSADIAPGAVTADGLADRSVSNLKLGVDVEGRIAALESAITLLQSINTSQQTMIDDLTARLVMLESNSALQLGNYVRIETGELNGVIGPHIMFEGVNLHVRNGSGSTVGAPNGLGNLFVGYNELRANPSPQSRVGSHNLVVGPEHSYSGEGAFVAGQRNWVLTSGGVLGGMDNTALRLGSVAGGVNNIAETHGAVLGGNGNRAWAPYSTVSGGNLNDAYGQYSSVSGGNENSAFGVFSWIGGGYGNNASGSISSIAAGFGNYAEGNYSSISGGHFRSVLGDYDWAAGGLWEDQ